MGHARLPPLPMSKKWRDIIRLIQCGGSASQVANATLHACEQGLRTAPDDPGVLEAVWLLMRLPLAARGDDFAAELARIGLSVDGDPDLPELVAAVTEAIDLRTPAGGDRSDLAEMARAAAAETLTDFLGGRLHGLFDTTPADVRGELARLATARQFGRFARVYFARFINRVLDYFIDRATPEAVGAGQRFRTIHQQTRFKDALDTHCRQTAAILETFAGDWLSKNNWETQGDVSRDLAARFIGYAVTKLTAELRRRNPADGR